MTNCNEISYLTLQDWKCWPLYQLDMTMMVLMTMMKEIVMTASKNDKYDKKEIVQSDDCIKDVKNLARLEVLASLPANRGVFGVEALVRPTA